MSNILLCAISVKISDITEVALSQKWIYSIFVAKLRKIAQNRATQQLRFLKIPLFYKYV